MAQLIDREHNTFTLHYVEDGRRRAIQWPHFCEMVDMALGYSKGGAAYISFINDEGDMIVTLYRDGSFVERKTVRCATLGIAA